MSYTNCNNIVIVPTVKFKNDEPPAKKPKLDLTPDKGTTENEPTVINAPKTTTPNKETSEDSKKSNANCVKKDIKVHSWASSYLQSIGQLAKPRMSVPETKDMTPSAGQPSAPIVQSNLGNTTNGAPTDLSTQYLYLNPLSHHFQMQTNVNSTQNVFCSVPPLNYPGLINYNPPISYPAPINNPAPTYFSVAQSYSAQINYTASLNYTAPIVNYPTLTNDTAPINYSAPLNYNPPANDCTAVPYYTLPLNHTPPLHESITLLNEPKTPPKDPSTPLVDEPNSPLSEASTPLNDSVTSSSLQYEPISPVSETTTPTKQYTTEKLETQFTKNTAEKERLAKDSNKGNESQLPKTENAKSRTNVTIKPKIRLNLIKKTDHNTKSNLESKAQEQKDKTHDRSTTKKLQKNYNLQLLRCENNKQLQSDKRTKTADPSSSSLEKVVNAHKSMSVRTTPKRKLVEPHRMDKETSTSGYSRKEDRKRKQPSEHYKHKESEFYKETKINEEKHTRYDKSKNKVIEKIKEIRSLYEKVKGTSNNKDDYNKPSTSRKIKDDYNRPSTSRKIRRSRTPESVQRKRPRTDPGNAVKDSSKKYTSPVRSVVQTINKIKYPTTLTSTKCLSPERSDAQVSEHFDLRTKLSRANKYFQKNSNHQLKDRDNLVVTINQPEVDTKPKPESPSHVTVSEKKIKSKSKKYKTIKLTIKVLCQDGEASGSSSSDDSEEELNAQEVSNSPNDLSFLDDFNVDEIVDSLKNSQKLNVNKQHKNPSHIKNTTAKNNQLNDRVSAVSKSRNNNDPQVIEVNKSNNSKILEDTIKIKTEQKYDSTINESNDCVILDTVEIGKVKTEVFDGNDESNDCVILNADNLINIKAESGVSNETDESCIVLDDTINIISIKSEPNDSVVEIKSNNEIKSETIENSNDCIVIENHPIKVEGSIKSGDNAKTELQHIKKELDNIADENKNVTNITGFFNTTINDNFRIHEEDTMEIPELGEEPMHVDEIENTQGKGDNIISDNCHSATNVTPMSGLFDIKQELCEIEIPLVTEAVPVNICITAVDMHKNEATEAVNKNSEKALSNGDTMNVVEIQNRIRMEPTVTIPITRDNIEISKTVENQDTNQDVQKTDNTKVVKTIENPVIKEIPLIESPTIKESLVEVEIIPKQNAELKNKPSPDTKTASEKIIATKPDLPKKADAKEVNNIETVSKNLEPVNFTKQNVNSSHDNETEKKLEQKIYECKLEGTTIDKAIKQEFINKIESELAHLKPKDSQAIIKAVTAKAEEMIKGTKPETTNVKSIDTSKVPNASQVTIPVEAEKRQVAIVKTKNSEELGEIKKQLEARMFEYLHERYTVTSLIHEGKFSKILKCYDSKDRNYIVKLLKNPSNRQSLGVEKEIILQKLQKDIPKENLNIITVINGFGIDRRWAFLMDYYPIDLRTAIYTRKKGFALDQMPALASQLIMAVMVLRNNGIVHSDIRPSHILLDESRQRLKLCGFDSCYYANRIEVLPNIGTVSYRAPEIIMGFSASYSIDVWSAATVLYEMFTKRKLFVGYFNNQVLFNQMCVCGEMPPDMIQRERSLFQSNHFEGRSFVRRLGKYGEKREIHHKFFKTQKLYFLLQSSYSFFWERPKKSRCEDLSKLYCFYELLDKMLVLDPRRRLPIEFVCAHPFINEFSS